jgi:hypothetical protein
MAQSGYEIRSAVVTPEYGYEDFTYSAQVWMNEEAAREKGVIAVTKFSLKLNIYDKGELIHSESSDQMGMSKTSFILGPYSFKNRFGIAKTSNATFEFIFYAAGQQVANTTRIKGPIVQPPELTGIQFDKTPYFFQGISVSAGFTDQEGLDPKPTCHLEITGPLGTSESRSWNSVDVSCRSSGKSAYTCTLTEDLSAYRNGGNFSFKLIYNNLKMNSLTYGPYNVSLRPYNSSVERLSIAKLLDYTNFTIQATVRDAAVKVEGSNPEDSIGLLMISHPQKGKITYSSSEPEVTGDKLVYRWSNDNDPVLFNRSDVQLSKAVPFMARFEYKNVRWDFSAESSNMSFNVVEEIPKLDIQYPVDVYVSSGESSSQEITATVTFTKGPGGMNFRLIGPAKDLNSIEKGTPLGGNKYQYKWQVSFDDRHVNNNYTLSLFFVHDLVEGGRYDFEDKTIHVSPVFVQFSDGNVSPAAGLWNDSFSYLLKMDTTVPLKVQLQTHDPCSNDWIKKETKEVSAGPATLNWTLRPFAYGCGEMAQQGAKYRFKASFAGEEIASSRAYDGPKFKGSSPVLISLDSDQVVYVSKGSRSTSSVQAIVEYAAGQGQAVLRLNGPEKSIEETSQGVTQGDNRYRYDWSLPFDEADTGKNFTYTVSYKHSSLPAELTLGEKAIAIKPIYVVFKNATVEPVKGRWNDTYLYSVTLNSSVETELALEVDDSCRYEWVTQARVKAPAGSGIINITATPFRDRCPDSEGKESRYRLAASFGKERYESIVYAGPLIKGEGVTVTLVALDYQPVLYVSKDRVAYQVVRATVDSSLEGAKMSLNIEGPGKSFEEQSDGSFLGGIRYVYTWSVPFTRENAGNHTISLRYIHPEKEMSFPEQTMSVVKEPENGQPQLLSFDYSPIIYVESDKASWQNITAEVFSPIGKGMLRLGILGPDRNETKTVAGEDKSGNIYLYRWSQPFDASNAGKNYRITASYLLAGDAYVFNDRIMSVVRKDGTPPQIWEPTLGLEYDRTVFVPVGGKADQVIRATINYSQGMGRLRLNLTGPDANISDIKDGQNAGDGRHFYTWVLPFADDSVGNEYKISLTYIHPTLPGGEYRFADRGMRVSAFEPGQIKFNNASVTPSHGSGLTRYTYCVDIETQLQEADIQLAIAGPNSSTFAPQHIVHYDGSNKTLCWTDMAINSNKGGNASFMFLSHVSNSHAYPGPRIEAINASGNVQPAMGVLQGFQITDDFYSYTYTASITNMSKGLMPWIELMVRPPNSGWRTVGNKLQYDPAKGSVSWTEKPFVNESFFGVAEFKFKIDELETQSFLGPEIVAIYDEPSWIKTGTKYSYWAWFNATENLTIDMKYSDDGQIWTPANKPQEYKANSGRTKKTWPDQAGHNEFEFDIRIKKEGGAA